MADEVLPALFSLGLILNNTLPDRSGHPERVHSSSEGQNLFEGVRRLVVYLIKPSRYDDQGFLVRHLRGVIPSNTLSVLHGLTLNASRSGVLGDVQVDTVLVDEAVHALPLRRIRRDSLRTDRRVLVALCGVQTSQFPRTADLARRFRRRGLTVVIGGFHVSGANALLPGVAPELREMLDIGVHLFRGEAEGHWEELLRNAITGTLPPVIDRLDAKPDLRDRPVPEVARRYLRRFALPDMSTIDAGRGCPFNCSFCTIINVQGRQMRGRSPRRVLEAVLGHYRQGARFFFFTDDNFTRHLQWRELLEGMAALRREGYEISFMMQVDALATRLEGFADLARDAGCAQVFVGVESLNPVNLAAAGKLQNRAADYSAMIQIWRERGIITNAGYILGFPADTPESIRRDVRRLRDEVAPDVVSFFMLMPLPGSMDHARAVAEGSPMDADLNRYDSFHAVTDHPRMSREAWEGAYHGAWREFYSGEHMKRCLQRLRGPTYWTLFHVYAWYRYALERGEHPMMSGLLRLRDRRERRPGWPIEGRMAHAAGRVRDLASEALTLRRLLFEMQELWLATRTPGPGEGRLRAGLASVLSLRPGECLGIASAWLNRQRRTRTDLSAFWTGLARLQWWRANPLLTPLNVARESALLVEFLLQLSRNRVNA